MCRLICVFVVRIWQKQVFSWRGSFVIDSYFPIRQLKECACCCFFFFLFLFVKTLRQTIRPQRYIWIVPLEWRHRILRYILPLVSLIQFQCFISLRQPSWILKMLNDTTVSIYSCVPNLFMGNEFCHNYLHTPDWYKRLLSVYVYLNLKLYHRMCLNSTHSFKTFELSVLKCHIKSCRNRTIEMNPNPKASVLWRHTLVTG